MPKNMGHLTHSSFYVGVTRVRDFDSIRLLPRTPGASLDHLLNLKPDPDLLTPISSFDSNGKFTANPIPAEEPTQIPPPQRSQRVPKR